MTEQTSTTPPELQEAIRQALNEKSSPTAYDYLEAAKRLLEKVLASECEDRSSALDLLTVDALVTHALEEAARDPATIETFADDAMRRIASLGAIR